MIRSLCLDTSAYSQFKRGRREIVDIISHARLIALPAIVLGELLFGFLKGTRREKNEKELAGFLAHPEVTILTIDGEVAETYAEIMSQLEKAGTPLPSNDIWIAAVAANQGLPVVTYDADFARIPRISARVLE